MWVSNVGVGAVGKFQETPASAHEQVIRSNLISHIHEAHVAVPVFLRQGQGIFINMISLGGFAATPFAAAYSASKFGLRGFSEALRAVLAPHRNIHLCDVYPTFVDAPGLSHGANYIGRRLTAPPPVADPRHVAAVIVRLAQHPRPTTMVGSVAHLARFTHLLAPNLQARLTAWLMRLYFRRADQVPVSDGNLFERPALPGEPMAGSGRRVSEMRPRSASVSLSS